MTVGTKVRAIENGPKMLVVGQATEQTTVGMCISQNVVCVYVDSDGELNAGVFDPTKLTVVQ